MFKNSPELSNFSRFCQEKNDFSGGGTGPCIFGFLHINQDFWGVYGAGSEYSDIPRISGFLVKNVLISVKIRACGAISCPKSSNDISILQKNDLGN